MHTALLRHARFNLYSLAFWLTSLISVGVLASIVIPLRSATNGISPEAAILGPGVLTLCLAIQLFGIALYALSYLLPAAGRAICRVFAWIFVVGFFLVSMSWYGFIRML
jgi:hypothetical protein